MVVEHSDSVKSKTKQFKEYVSSRVFKDDREVGVPSPPAGQPRGPRVNRATSESSNYNNASSAQLVKVIIRRCTVFSVHDTLSPRVHRMYRLVPFYILF